MAYNGILDGAGGNDVFNFNTAVASVSNLIGGDGSDRINTSISNVLDENIDSLITITGTNKGLLSINNATTVASFEGISTINARGNADTVTSDNDAHTWFINAAVTLDGITVNTIETVLGQSAVDTFDITGAFAGTLQGGGENDVFNFNSNTASVNSIKGNAGDNVINTIATSATTVTITGSNTGTLSTGASNALVKINDFSDIATIDARNGGDTVTSDDAAHTWLIGSAVTLDGIAVSNAETVLGQSGNDIFTVSSDFTGTINGAGGNDTFNVNATVSSLLGGAGNDSFVINGGNTVADGGEITTLLDGGEGTDTLTGRTTNTNYNLFSNDLGLNGVTNGVYVTGITNTETFVGRGTNDRLFAPNGDNIFTLDVTTNTLTNGSATFMFSGMNELLGGNSGSDRFNIVDASQIIKLTGSRPFGDGANSTTNNTVSYTSNGNATWQLTGNNAGSLSVDGGASNVTFSLISTIEGSGAAGVTTTLVGQNQDTTWDISANGGGTVDGLAFSNINVIQGNEKNDTFTVTVAQTNTLIDGGEGTNGGGADKVDVTSFTAGIVVELGIGTPVSIDGSVTAPADRININNIEQLNAMGSIENDRSENPNNWIAIRHDREHKFNITSRDNGFVSDVNINGDVIGNSQLAFQNFGSFLAGSSTVTSDIVEDSDQGFGNISGVQLAGGGLQNLIYDNIDSSIYIVVDVTDNIASIVGNGNTLLRVTDLSGLSTTDFNVIENTWSITGVDSGTFKSKVNDGNELVDFEFNFSQVNNLQGGTSTDTFTFLGDGQLVGRVTNNTMPTTTVNFLGGSINGNGGNDSVILDGINQDLIFGINGTISQGAFAPRNPPGMKNITVDNAVVLRSGVINIAGIQTLNADLANTPASAADSATDSATDFNLQLRSGDSNSSTSPYMWQVMTEGTGTLTNSDSESQSLMYSGITTIAGGSADDTFNISDLSLINHVLDGGAGIDVVISSDANERTLSLNTDPNIVSDLTVTNIETLTLGSGVNTLIGDNAINAWAITSSNVGNVVFGGNTVNFTKVASITGGTLNDDFVFTGAGSLTGAIDGGTGANTIAFAGTSTNNASTEATILEYNAAVNATAGTIAFSNINSITRNGGAANVTIVGGAVTSNWQLVNGGTHIYTPSQGDGFTFSGVNDIKGGTINTENTDTLTGANKANIWQISGDKAGSIDGANGLAFSNISGITGNAVTDTFNIAASTSTTFKGAGGDDIYNINASGIAVTITELDNNGNDTLTAFSDAANTNIWVVDANSTLTNNGQAINFTQIETLNGNNLAGDTDGDGKTTSDAFTINNFSGTINSLGGNDTFAINSGAASSTIVAGIGADTFNVADASIALTLFGGTRNANANIADASIADASDDTLNYTGAAAATWVLNNGNRNNGALNTNVAFNDIAQIDNTVSTNNTLTAGNAVNNWVIDAATGGTIRDTGSDADSVNTVSFSGFQTLNGGSLVDIFAINAANALAINTLGGNDVITISANSTGAISGGAGDDAFTLVGDISADVDGNDGANTLTTNTASAQTWQLAANTNNNTRNGTVTFADGLMPNAKTSFTNIDSITGGAGDTTVVVADGASLTRFDGNTGNNTLNINSGQGDTVAWTINGANTGTVSNIVDDFSNFANLNGGDGNDAYNFTVSGTQTGSISGLINAGESSADADTLDVSAFTNGVIIELGEAPENGPDQVSFEPAVNVPNRINIVGFETVTANGTSDPTGENNNWVAILHNRDVDFAGSDNPTPQTQNNFTVTETTVELDDEGKFVRSINTEGTQTSFFNFGSAQGGAGRVSSNLSAGENGNITGEYREGTGLLNLDYSNNSDVTPIVVDITTNLESIIGNGNVLLRAGEGDASLNGTDNRWIIDGVNSGTVATTLQDTSLSADEAKYKLVFSGINQLQGGTSADTFTFAATGNLIDGSINGNGGVNTLTTNANTDQVFGVNILGNQSFFSPRTNSTIAATALENRAGVIDIADITRLTATTPADISTQLISAQSGVYQWNITAGSADLTLVDQTDPDDLQTLVFTGVDSIKGGGANDTFIVSDLSRVGGVFDGGVGTNTLNLSGMTTAVSLSLDESNIDSTGSFINGVNVVGSNITRYVGNAQSATSTGAGANASLSATGANNTWAINGINAGTLSYNTGADNVLVSFDGFNTLSGGNAIDDFTLVNNAVITGTVNGGNGDNSVMLDIAQGVAGALDYRGGQDSDTVRIDANTQTVFDANYATRNANRDVDLAFTQKASNETFSLSLSGVDNITNAVNVETLTVNTNGAQPNAVLLEQNTVVVATQPTAGPSNALIAIPNLDDFVTLNNVSTQSLTVDATSADVISVVGSLNFTGDLTFVNATIDTDANSLVNANNAFNLVNTSSVGTQDTPLSINTANIMFDGVRGDSHLLHVGTAVQSDINIAGINNTTDAITLTLADNGSVTSSADLVSSGALTINASGDITLDQNNNLTGLISLISPDSNIVLNNGKTDLAAIQARNFSLTSRGNVNDFGTIAVSATTTLSGLDATSMVFDNPQNSFSSIELLNGGDLTLINSSAADTQVRGSFSGLVDITTAQSLIVNALNANRIALNSTSGAIAVNEASSAQDNITLNAQTGITIDGQLSVANSAGDTAINLTTATQGIQLNRDLIAQGEIDGNVVLNAGSITQAQNTAITGRNVTINAQDDIRLEGANTALEAFDITSQLGNINLVSVSPLAALIANSVNIFAQTDINTGLINASQAAIQSQTGQLRINNMIDVGNITLAADGSDIVIDGTLNVADNFDAQAQNGAFNLLNGSAINSSGTVFNIVANSLDVAGDITAEASNANISVANNAVINSAIAFNSLAELAAGGQISMTNVGNIVVTDSATVRAGGDFLLSRITAGNNVVLDIGGAVSDVIGDEVNITAASLFADSGRGFGTDTNQIDTSLPLINVANGTGIVGIINDQDVSIAALLNNGTTTFTNTMGDVTIINAITEDLTVEGVGAVSGTRASLVAVDSGIENGNLTIDVVEGRLAAFSVDRADARRPDIVSDQLTVKTLTGFGMDGRSIVVYSDNFTLSGPGFRPIFAFGIRPTTFSVDQDLLDNSFNVSSADLLLELESLVEIDPAVFSNVLNYVYEDISIKMPSDQLFDEDDEEEDEEDDEVALR